MAVVKKKVVPLPRLLKKAERVFNAYIRKRDRGSCCVSCGQYRELQAGHYVPVKKSSYLRFSEYNVNGECAGCNGFDDFHLIGYRKRLIEKIGLEMVEWLEENSRRTHKWSREQLEEIIAKYK